jgi:hypothetical protein
MRRLADAALYACLAYAVFAVGHPFLKYYVFLYKVMALEDSDTDVARLSEFDADDRVGDLVLEQAEKAGVSLSREQVEIYQEEFYIEDGIDARAALHGMDNIVDGEMKKLKVRVVAKWTEALDFIVYEPRLDFGLDRVIYLK